MTISDLHADPGASPRRGSLHDSLRNLARGERHYVDTTATGYAAKMRHVGSIIARSGVLSGRRYVTSALTAVGTKLGDVRHLVAIERTR